MTSREKKIARLKRLAADVNSNLEVVAKISTEIRELTDEINKKSGPVDNREMMLMAAYLHHFYTGLESMFERISGELDGGVGRRGDYHREVLRSMTIDIEGVRPRVISPELAEELDDYRKFRHMFRHAYAAELRWKKMSHLALNIATIYNLVEINIKGFATFLLNLASRM